MSPKKRHLLPTDVQIVPTLVAVTKYTSIPVSLYIIGNIDS